MALTEFAFTTREDLRIGLTPDGRTYLHRQHHTNSRWTDTEIFLELIDEHLLDGWYVVPADQVRTTTRSVLLSRDIRFDQGGAIGWIGSVYWYPRCELEPYIETIQRTGYLIFEKGN
jgi:hypothetical protein